VTRRAEVSPAEATHDAQLQPTMAHGISRILPQSIALDSFFIKLHLPPTDLAIDSICAYPHQTAICSSEYPAVHTLVVALRGLCCDAGLGNFTKAVGKGMGNPCFRIIQTHFAKNNNVGDVAAKEQVRCAALHLQKPTGNPAIIIRPQCHPVCLRWSQSFDNAKAFLSCSVMW